MTERFELSLYGGAIERRYRRRCPEVEALPWASFDRRAFDPLMLDRARLGWTYASLQEYESTAVHAAALSEMLRARIPLDLVAMSTEFQREELTHAELCARLAMTLGGGSPIPFVPTRVPISKGSPALAVGEFAVGAFAVSETYAHAMLKAGTERATTPLFRSVRALLAKDEAAHGRMGWVLLEELMPDYDDAERTRLRKVAAHALGQLEARAEAALTRPRTDFGELTAMGPFEPEAYRALGHAAIAGITAKLGALDLV